MIKDPPPYEDSEDTLTLRELVDLSLTVEEGETEDEAARSALVSVLGVFRSVIQGEIATNDEIYASALKWTEQHGKPTIDSVREWVYGLKGVDIPIPLDFVKKVLEAD